MGRLISALVFAPNGKQLVKELRIRTLYWSYLVLQAEIVLNDECVVLPDLELILSKYGEEGWELIQIIQLDDWTLIFKRSSHA